MSRPRKIFARNLKEKRQSCGFSQAKLAEQVNVSTHHIAMIETAKNFPTSELIERIANVLNIEIYELFIEEGHFPGKELRQLRTEIRDDVRQLLADFSAKNCGDSPSA